MELFGIALSVPVAFVASMLYCFFLDRVVLKFEGPRRWLLFTSYFVLAFFSQQSLLCYLLSARCVAVRFSDALSTLFT